MRNGLLWLAAVLVGVLTAGCVATVEGTPMSANKSAGIAGIGRSIADVLPDDAEVSEVVGAGVGSRGFPPFVGGLDVLPDGIRETRDASEIQCLGVVMPHMKKPFEAAPVRAVAFHDWDNWGSRDLEGPSFSIDAGAIALESPADARALFADFVNQWLQCNGKTMVVYRAAGGPDHLNEVAQVNATDTMLSAVVMLSAPATHTPASPNQRALGIAANCIVDVNVAETSWRRGDPISSDLAVKIAELMLAKISATT